MDEKKVHLDEILSKFGVLSRYQLQTLVLIGFVFFVNELHSVGFIFYAEDVLYRCDIEQCESEGKAYEQTWYNFTNPANSKECYKYEVINNSTCEPQSFNTTAVVPCQDWVYNVNDSFVSEFQLACQDWKRAFVGTVRSIGLMIGLFFQGQFSDRFGRKVAIIFSAMAAGVLGLAKSYSTSYWTFIVLELIESAFGDNCSPAYIYSIELMSSEFRVHMHIVLCLICSIGAIFLSLTAYYLRYWRYFIQAVYIPSFIFIIYYFTLDESVRWLLSKGKKDKAIEVLKKMSNYNKVNIDEKVLLSIQTEENENEKSPLINTLRSKIVMKRFLVCLVWWISCTFICFGLLINVVSLAGNKYFNFGLLSIFDVPASIAMVYTLNRFQRKKPLLTSFTLAGLLCLIQPFIPKEITWLSTGIYVLGRFLTTFTFTTVYLYTSELFPTYTRNSLHALCSAIGRIGSILAPMTPLLSKYMESLPTLLIGVISLLAGCSTFFVPDVVGEDYLPDNVKQAECIGNNNKQEKPNKIV